MEKASYLSEILIFNKLEYDNQTGYEAGDSTIVKITDIVAFSDKAKEILKPRHPDRIGWLVGAGISTISGERLLKVIWWGTKTKTSYHHSFIKKHLT